MNESRGTGVFGSVGNSSNQSTHGESKPVELTQLPETSQDTIYNILFKEFDEEKSE